MSYAFNVNQFYLIIILEEYWKEWVCLENDVKKTSINRFTMMLVYSRDQQRSWIEFKKNSYSGTKWPAKTQLYFASFITYINTVKRSSYYRDRNAILYWRIFINKLRLIF